MSLTNICKIQNVKQKKLQKHFNLREANAEEVWRVGEGTFGRVEMQTVPQMTADELKAGDMSSAGVGLVSLASSGMSELHARSRQNQPPQRHEFGGPLKHRVDTVLAFLVPLLICS